MNVRFRLAAVCTLLTAIFASVSACGGSSQESADGKGTVTMWYLADQTDFVKAMKKKFEAANPGIKLEATAVPEDNYVTKIDTAILAHRPPDIVFMYDSKWMKAGNVVPIDGLMKKAGVDLSVFSKVPMAECKLDGKTYCVGSLGGAHMIIYNKSLFDAASVPYPSATQPMTIDQFASLAEKLTQPSGDPGKRVYGALTGSPISGVVTPLSFFSADGKRVEGYADSPPTIHLLDVMANMVRNDVSVPPATQAQKADADLLTSRQVAMAITDMEYTSRALDRAGIKWGAAPPPVEQAGDKPYVFGGTDKYGILKDGENTKGAEKFITMLAQRGSQIRLNVTDTPPLDKRLLSKWAAHSAGRKDVVKVLSLSQVQPIFVPYYWDQVTPLDNLYTQLANGHGDAESSLTKLAPDMQKNLDTAWKTWNAIH